jgi:hypothetical protein
VSDDLTAWLRKEIEGDLGIARHILDMRGARPDPRREMHDAIADCEAKLAILDEHYILIRDDRDEAYEEFSIIPRGGANQDRGCVTCHYEAMGGVRGAGVCRTVKLLGTGYRHRPGYQEAWKP